MKLAINYSPAAADLVRSGQIEIDYFKTPDWDTLIAEGGALRPVAVHFNLDAGNNSLEGVDWDKALQQMDATGTPYINFHLDARQSYYPEFAVDTDAAKEVEVVVKVILSDVMKAVQYFGAERVIIENSACQGLGGNTLSLCTRPDIISRIASETGCGLLLDVAHAIIAARHLGINPDEYLSSLPVKRIKELHFAGIHWIQETGMWMDHLSIQKEDWYWLDWVLEHINSGGWSSPWLLAFEYGGVGEPFKWRSDPQVIARQVPQLRQHLELLGG